MKKICRESCASFSMMKCNVPLMNATLPTHSFYLNVVRIYSSEILTCNLGLLLVSFIYFFSQILVHRMLRAHYFRSQTQICALQFNDISFLCVTARAFDSAFTPTVQFQSFPSAQRCYPTQRQECLEDATVGKH